ncbi:MAG: CDP-diacylglycerol--glycerol-3-phosphate 3-phosphatidyltransferase [Gammaproteobacteria bacterium]|jgi:CDP-diacylglycerol--glycerol-3-phosphate 3-phosphatidyltransferase|nr:CDP-diacylglycerol--glycerol-3-phosphate 3-phosphatidyltransferase [Gammaproteobacteria bacterium]MBT4461996.1 CDP-diacylglycerol--glycerol-3-phosphate 3-phosphatidyltransferase [Gammaproteobacteria bacterium]MBT4654508.1 CDP-diacylglycerol--glycerol-3-phosphate 3-phosphatidyltransferase [Gammaproteobacteria bacterium]MBT5761449.1 CDP-diacylglycerol--glycerol-3-phosphate 3-phosphatidyltransferase [Gammaproteobacteria bacterium]MBT6332012.1 CDP-diacylglycerol--glycerol-3-phosphate 3-phosphati
MKFNIPNSLTLVRILLIPIIVCLFLLSPQGYRTIIFSLFLLATITDYLDGFFARYMKQVTNFGTFLDPVADKLLVIITLILLITENQDIFFLVPVLIIITREFLVIAIRQRLAEAGDNIKLSVLFISKIKTAIQLISLLLLLYKFPLLGIDIYQLGIHLLQIASLLTLISFFYYVKKSWNVIIK